MGLAGFISAKLLANKTKHHNKETSLTGVSMAAISLGMAVMTISVMVVTGFKKEIESKIRGFASDIRITEFGSDNPYDEAPMEFSDVKRKTSHIPGVSKIQAYATKAGIIKTDSEIQGVLLKGVSQDFDLSFIQKNLVEGRIPNLSEQEAGKEIAISLELASMLELKCNDTITIYFIEDPPRVRKLLICGVYNTGLGEFDKLYAFCNIGLVQKLNNWDSGKSGGIEVLLDPSTNTQSSLEAFRTAIGFRYQAMPLSEQYPQIFQWLELQNVNVFIIILLILAISGVSMISTLLIIILNRTRMIGLLKALGANDRLIRDVFIRLSIPIILKGMLIGNVIGIGLGILQDQFGFIKLSEASYYVSKVPVNISVTDLLLLNLGTFAVCFLMLLGPSLIIAKVSPSKTLRFD